MDIEELELDPLTQKWVMLLAEVTEEGKEHMREVLGIRPERNGNPVTIQTPSV